MGLTVEPLINLPQNHRLKNTAIPPHRQHPPNLALDIRRRATIRNLHRLGNNPRKLPRKLVLSPRLGLLHHIVRKVNQHELAVCGRCCVVSSLFGGRTFAETLQPSLHGFGSCSAVEEDPWVVSWERNEKKTLADGRDAVLGLVEGREFVYDEVGRVRRHGAMAEQTSRNQQFMGGQG
jgi:hypothetical protein